MGTNYYARIIPTKERRKELCNLIESSKDYKKILNEVRSTFDIVERDYDTEGLIGGVVHLGKRSGGWKFLWNPNCYVFHNGHMEGTKYVQDPSTLYYLYQLTKEGIKKFIDREDIEIYDEYGDQQDKELFFEMALDWTTWKSEEAWDSKSYDEYEKKNTPNYNPLICRSELIDLLKRDGYIMNSYTQSDFYSDGLRFSTSTEFS